MAYDEDLAGRVRSSLHGTKGLTEKAMFGGIGFLVDGNMACGVHGNRLIVRVGPEAHSTVLGTSHTSPFDLTGRPMKGWFWVEPAGLNTADALGTWIRQGLQFARTLPAK
jgi:TfoX/Sxy family transcriptional regulator of competence genes